MQKKRYERSKVERVSTSSSTYQPLLTLYGTYGHDTYIQKLTYFTRSADAIYARFRLLIGKTSDDVNYFKNDQELTGGVVIELDYASLASKGLLLKYPFCVIVSVKSDGTNIIEATGTIDGFSEGEGEKDLIGMV